MSDFFDALKEGLEDAIAHNKGKKTLRTHSVELPSPPQKYSAKDIKKIRKKLNYSQAVFAMVLNVSTKTVQAWESGERSPSGSSLRLLEIMDHGELQAEYTKSAGKKKKNSRSSYIR